jgi:hypothetical protein
LDGNPVLSIMAVDYWGMPSQTLAPLCSLELKFQGIAREEHTTKNSAAVGSWQRAKTLFNAVSVNREERYDPANDV